MKKILTFIAIMTAILSFNVCVFADTAYIDRSETMDCIATTEEINSFRLPYAEPVFEHLLPMSRVAYVTVYISSPCDEDFREAHPSDYAYQANAAIETADDYLSTAIGLDYVNVAQFPWTYTGFSLDAGDILQSAISKHGLKYNGNLTSDMMIAFSGLTPVRGIVGRTNEIGGDYVVIFDTNSAGNSYNVQHETGHVYGLYHHHQDPDPERFPDTPVCVMNQGLESSDYNHLCGPHLADWISNKNKY